MNIKEQIYSIISEESDQEYEYKVMIKTTPKIRNEFETELDKLFKKYTSKTSDGYVKTL